MNRLLLLLLAGAVAAQSDFLALTASSSNHFVPLCRLLVSLAKHEPTTPILFYDLGLTPEQARWVKTVRMVEYRVFPFRSYPGHFALDQVSYAWKPEIIQKARKEYRYVLYMDAGDQLNGPIRRSLTSFLDTYSGFYSGMSSGTLRDWSHPKMIEKLPVPEVLLNTPNCNAAMLGFGPGSEALVSEWVQCAMDKGCITPEGSSRKDHRQDQSALGLLVARSRDQYRCVGGETVNPLYAIHTEYSATSRVDLQFSTGVPLSTSALMDQWRDWDRDDPATAIALELCRALGEFTTDPVRLLIDPATALPESIVRRLFDFLGPASPIAWVGSDPPAGIRFHGPARMNDGAFALVPYRPKSFDPYTAVITGWSTGDDALPPISWFATKEKRLAAWIVDDLRLPFKPTKTIKIQDSLYLVFFTN